MSRKMSEVEKLADILPRTIKGIIDRAKGEDDE